MYKIDSKCPKILENEIYIQGDWPIRVYHKRIKKLFIKGINNFKIISMGNAIVKAIWVF